MEKSGATIIPASRRPDGTLRKEVVIRAGYVPPDEVRAFQTRGNSGKPKGIPGLAPKPANASVSHNPKEPKKASSSQPTSQAKDHPAAKSASTEQPTSTNIVIAPSSVPNNDKEKKLKALRKKLRDIDELALRDPNTLNAEQVEKLSKRSLLLEELRSLEDSP